VLDPQPARLARARQLGATAAVASVAECMKELEQDYGCRKILECSGTDAGFAQAAQLAADETPIALLGMTAARTLAFPILSACQKEVEVHCYSHAQPLKRAAAQLVQSGKLNLAPLITHRLPWDKAEEAFALAAQPDGDAIRISLEPENLDEPFHP